MQQPAADNGTNQSKPNQTRDDNQTPIIENTSNHNGTGLSSLPNTATNIFNWMLIGTLLLFIGISVWLIQSYRKKQPIN
ncbi:LPXTG cell wall anchor domain-containing protein [Virgibacillus proomii]|uniref:LPXTG cell wall anchor domain-containing protein n=1 Tax=Virgibacillus proomii TaxID=84407 RepID=UPI001C1021E9|nr:LPXTG cell wall anchor domain-containing protein [Virgibacillus proomii]MBU5266972.1 LPXTG cell wall anchor domain-containing protein [Virgibacillus proomii]